MLMFRLKTTPLSELFMSADLRAQWVDPFGRLVRCRLHFRLDKQLAGPKYLYTYHVESASIWLLCEVFLSWMFLVLIFFYFFLFKQLFLWYLVAVHSERNSASSHSNANEWAGAFFSLLVCSMKFVVFVNLDVIWSLSRKRQIDSASAIFLAKLQINFC